MIDDEPLVRETISRQVEAAGHAVVAVAHAREALDLLDAGEAVDLIVTDLSMPGMNGIALVREAHRRHPKLPAILLTGFVTDAAEIAVRDELSSFFRYCASRSPKPNWSAASPSCSEAPRNEIDGGAAKTLA